MTTIQLSAELQKKLDQLEQDAPPKVQEQIRLLDSDELDSKLAAAERLSTMGREAEGAAGAEISPGCWVGSRGYLNGRFRNYGEKAAGR